MLKSYSLYIENITLLETYPSVFGKEDDIILPHSNSEKKLRVGVLDSEKVLLQRIAINCPPSEIRIVENNIYTDAPKVKILSLYGMCNLIRMNNSEDKCTEIIKEYNKYFTLTNIVEAVLTYDKNTFIGIATFLPRDLKSQFQYFTVQSAPPYKQKEVKEDNVIVNLDKDIKSKKWAFTDTSVKRVLFKLEHIDTLRGLFNAIHATLDVPCIVHDTFYKVHRTFTPEEEWHGNKWSILCIRSNLQVIRITKSDQEFLVEYDQALSDVDSDKTLSDVITHLLSSITSSQPTIRESRLDIGQMFKYTHIDPLGSNEFNKLQNAILADVVMNVAPFKDYLSVNDNRKHPMTHGNRLLYFTLSGKTVIASVTYKPLNEITFKLVKGTDNTMFHICKTLIFGVLLTMLKSELKVIVINDIAKEQKGEGVRGFLHSINPDVFTKHYARLCQPKGRHPTIITQSDFQSDNQGHLMFPKEPTVYNNAEIPVNYYKCSEAFPNKGLVHDPASAIKYAPCCFGRDSVQDGIDNKNTNYWCYMENRPRVKKDTGYVKVGEAPVYNDVSAEITNNELTDFFSKITGKKLYRKGRGNATTHANSLLECFNDTRESFAIKCKDKEYIAKQECYDMTIDQIKAELADSRVFLDPFKYIRLVEHVYNTNIILFTTTNEPRKSRMALPRHLCGRYTFTRAENPTTMIYVNYGAQSNQSDIPHCELLEFDKELNDSEWSKVWEIYDKLSTFYIREKQVLPINISSPIIRLATKQYIDSYGKVRRVCVKSQNNEEWWIETSPLPPIPPVEGIETSPLPHVEYILEPHPLTMLTTDQMKSLMSKLGIEKYIRYAYTTTTQDKLYLYAEGWTSDNICVRIQMLNYTINWYDKYIKDTRLANYLTESSIYQMAKHVMEDEQSLQTLTNRIKRVTQTAKVQVSFELPEVKSESVQPEVKSENVTELEEQLIHKALRIYETDPDKVASYLSKKSIDSVLAHPRHFDLAQDEQLVSCHNLVDAFRPEQLYPLVDTWLTGVPDGIFFFKHPIITGDKAYLTQSTESIDHALGKLDVWETYRYNPVGPVTTSNYIPYYVYIQQPNQTYKRYLVGEGDRDIMAEDASRRHIIITLTREYLPLLDPTHAIHKILVS